MTATIRPNVDAVIGKNVHDLLWQRRMRQRPLANAIGLSASVLSKKLRGESEWSATQVAQVAAVLGVSPGALYAETALTDLYPSRFRAAA